MEKVILFSKKSAIFDLDNVFIGDLKIEQTDLFREDLPWIIVKFLRIIGGPFLHFAFGSWKKRRYDIAIFSDSETSIGVIDWITKNPISNNNILFFWNSITNDDKKKLSIAKASGFIPMTYNKHDAFLYGINYESQCWNSSLVQTFKHSLLPDVDVIFVGKSKNRYDELVRIKEYFELNSIKAEFHIISKGSEPYTEKKDIDYLSYLQRVEKSKAVLDVVSSTNWGLTWRPLEALFMKKKLITNYTDIISYDFYTPFKNNIFVIGIDKDESISDFINKEYEDCDFNLNHYRTIDWIQRICRTINGVNNGTT